MTKFGAGPRLPAEQPPPIERKAEILWGCERGGSPRFPRDLPTLYSRRNSPNPVPMNAFGAAVMEASSRVWILDGYLLAADKAIDVKVRISTILGWLPDHLVASDVRILTTARQEVTSDMLDLFVEREGEINARNPRRKIQCRIQVCTLLRRKFDFMHDRFAIIDDELWHFGATVGGFHTGVNAASRGWNAVESGAIDFFKLAWSECKE